MKNPKAAFTLIELLAVLAVVAFLGAMLLPGISRAKSKGREASCISNLKQLGIALSLYADEHEDRLPAAEPLPSHPVATNPPLSGIASVLSNYTGGVARLFRCPEDTAGRFQTEGSSYEWNYAMNGKSIVAPKTEGAIPVGQDVFFFGGMEWVPVATPLLYDYENFHFGGTSGTNGVRAHKNAVFADGHVGRL